MSTEQNQPMNNSKFELKSVCNVFIIEKLFLLHNSTVSAEKKYKKNNKFHLKSNVYLMLALVLPGDRYVTVLPIHSITEITNAPSQLNILFEIYLHR